MSRFIAVLLIVFTISLTAPVPVWIWADGDAPAVKMVPCEPLTVIPSFVCMWTSQDESTIEGLRIWQKVTDTAIVTTRPGRADLFPALQAAVPGMRIIPGLKTKDLVDDLDNCDDWQAVAQEVFAVLTASGGSTIMLENESTLLDYVDGVETIDISAFHAGLLQLPSDVEYIWRPSIYWWRAGQDGYQRLKNLTVIVESSLENVRFESQRYCDPDQINNQVYVDAEVDLRNIATRPTFPKLYFYGSDHPDPWWLDHQVQEALAHVRSDWGPTADVEIYFGSARTVTAAPILTAQLHIECE